MTRFTDGELSLMSLAGSVLEAREARQSPPPGLPEDRPRAATPTERPPKPWKQMTSTEAREWIEGSSAAAIL